MINFLTVEDSEFGMQNEELRPSACWDSEPPFGLKIADYWLFRCIPLFASWYFFKISLRAKSRLDR